MYEHEQNGQTLIDLSETLEREEAEAFIGRFQRQNQKRMAAKLNQLLAA